MRVVYDCADKYGGTSLNQQLFPGPDQPNQSVGVLSQFGQESVGVVADMEGMFHQMLVEPKDCDVLRFMWWPNGDLSGEMEECQMVKHLFGATSSPSIANFCLQQTAKLNRREFEADTVETVKHNTYVDDFYEVEEYHQNSHCVSESTPRTACKRWFLFDDLDKEKLPTETKLGLKLSIEEDKFVWEVTAKVLRRVSQEPVTNRGIVSAVNSLFDPLGFLAPYAMKAKLLLQTLSRKRLGWNDKLEETNKEQWKHWLDDLPKLHQIRVDRSFKPKGFGEVKKVELHLFSDTSRQGYATVAYLRLKDETN